MTDEHIVLLAQSPHLLKLRWLSIMLNDVDVADALARAKHLENLATVVFYGNKADRTETRVDDQGVVLERFLPEDGKDLERRYGWIRWLHGDVQR